MIAVKRRTLAPGYKAPESGPIRVAFFDADSTLRISRSGNVSANGPRDVALLPGVSTKLKQLEDEGYLIAVISNQGGVARGYVSLEDADAALAYMVRLLARNHAFVSYYDFAEAKNSDRKPDIGMAKRLELEVLAKTGREIHWQESFMVGDSAWKRKHDLDPEGAPGEDFSNSDRRFAEAVRVAYDVPDGFAFHHPRSFFGWIHLGVRNFRKFPEIKAFTEANPNFPR